MAHSGWVSDAFCVLFVCLFRKLARARSALGSRVFTIIDTRGDCVFEKPTKSNRGKLRARFYTYIAAQRSAIILLLRVCAVQWCSLLSRAGHLYSISAAHIRPMCAGTAFCTLKMSKCVVFLSPAKRARKHSTHRHNHTLLHTYPKERQTSQKPIHFLRCNRSFDARNYIIFVYIFYTWESSHNMYTLHLKPSGCFAASMYILYVVVGVSAHVYLCRERELVCVCVCAGWVFGRALLFTRGPITEFARMSAQKSWIRIRDTPI